MSLASEEIIELGKEHIKPAAAMLARAFSDDPIMAYAYSDEANASLRFPHIYEFLLRYQLSYAQGFATSERLEGVAVWQRYRRTSFSLWRMLTTGAIWPALRMGTGAGKKMQPFFEYLERKHDSLISSPHWYLMLLGVVPEFQGMGYAGKLLRHMLSPIDEEGLPCYLETEKEVNVSLYQHFGFKVIDEFVVPWTPVKLWVMLRDGKSPASTSEGV